VEPSPGRAGRGQGEGLFLSLLLLFSFLFPAHAEIAYPPVVPGIELEFPRDEGAHPEHRLEWWYVTGLVEDERGTERGFQVTFFRVRPGLGEQNPSSFAPRQILFGHAAIADPEHGRLRHAERTAREGFGLAYARESHTEVRLEDWSLVQEGDRYRARVSGEDFSLELELRRTQAPLLQGERGFSRKGRDPRSASYYYSHPHMSVSGRLLLDGRETTVRGEAWLDHEWSSDFVEEGAQGWDWMGINLADGGALMAFRMRGTDGGKHWAAGTLRTPEGEQRAFAPEEVDWTPLATWRSPRTGAEYPVRWRVRVGEAEYTIEPLVQDAELDSRASTGTIYWEGPVRLLGPDGVEAGRGYLELTGYAGRLDL